jgi:hypothetical protein
VRGFGGGGVIDVADTVRFHDRSQDAEGEVREVRATRATGDECLNCWAVDICHRELVSLRTTRPELQRDTLLS